jgi:hypothetical protein
MQWLQSTPEMPALAALHLPVSRRQIGADAEATSAMSLASCSFLHGFLRDAGTAFARQSDASLDVSWGNMDVGKDVLPLTPCSSSVPTATPPPGACFEWQTPSPASSPLASRTPSPSYGQAPGAPFQPSFQLSYQQSWEPSAASMCQPVQQAQWLAAVPSPPVLPMLLGATNSFAALGTWSTGCEGYDGDAGHQGDLAEASWSIADPGEQVTWQFDAVPEVSAGSGRHGSGRCRPCAFVHRSVGCADGIACKFCHLCEPGEKKRRQKQKAEQVQQRRRRRAATGVCSGEATEECCSLPVALA